MNNPLFRFWIIIIFVFPFYSISQLDSINISLQIENYEYINEFNDSLTGQSIKVDTWINDFDFFGEILITAYDVESDFPVEMLKYTKVQIETEEMIIDNVITARVYNSIEAGRSYRIEVQVRDYQGMNLALKQVTIEID